MSKQTCMMYEENFSIFFIWWQLYDIYIPNLHLRSKLCIDIFSVELNTSGIDVMLCGMCGIVPFSRQADLRLCGTALAESKELAYYLDGFSQHRFSAGLQPTITSLQDQIWRPEL